MLIPSATSRGLSEYLWRIEQPTHAVANGYFVGTINRVGIEPLGDDDFYGQSYFCDPRGQFVGDVGDAHEEELIVRDLDLDLITQVRQTWQFYRDRRPGRLRRPRPTLIGAGDHISRRREPSAREAARIAASLSAWGWPWLAAIVVAVLGHERLAMVLGCTPPER